jgi:hypothetical protein
MRKSLVFIVLIVAGMMFNSGFSAAAPISQATAKALCKGKASTGRGGCTWCDQYFCRMVSCDEDGVCDFVTQSTGKKKKN